MPAAQRASHTPAQYTSTESFLCSVFVAWGTAAPLPCPFVFQNCVRIFLIPDPTRPAPNLLIESNIVRGLASVHNLILIQYPIHKNNPWPLCTQGFFTFTSPLFSAAKMQTFCDGKKPPRPFEACRDRGFAPHALGCFGFINKGAQRWPLRPNHQNPPYPYAKSVA
jgi:hypothetical protein